MQVPHQDETVPGPLRESARVCSIVLRDDVGEGIAYSPDGVVTQRLASIMAKLLGAPPPPTHARSNPLTISDHPLNHEIS